MKWTLAVSVVLACLLVCVLGEGSQYVHRRNGGARPIHVAVRSSKPAPLQADGVKSSGLKQKVSGAGASHPMSYRQARAVEQAQTRVHVEEVITTTSNVPCVQPSASSSCAFPAPTGLDPSLVLIFSFQRADGVAKREVMAAAASASALDASLYTAEQFQMDMAAILSLSPSQIRVIEFGVADHTTQQYIAVFELLTPHERQSGAELYAMVNRGAPELVAHGFVGVSMKEVGKGGVVVQAQEPGDGGGDGNGGGDVSGFTQQLFTISPAAALHPAVVMGVVSSLTALLLRSS